MAQDPHGTLSALPAGIVADDLTGATDSAVQFARDGWAARLALTVPSAGSATPGSVTAVVTDARPMPAGDAHTATATAVRELLYAGARRLFVKIDSTMRGTVMQQIEGALDAWGDGHPNAIAIVCSAYPAMGRTIAGGHILVNGEGVHLTSVGTDPVTPVATSDLRHLLPGSAHVALSADTPHAERSTALLGALHAAIDTGARVISVDASTDADLALLAEAIGSLGDRAIPVGAAGLAVAMSRVWAAQGRAPLATARARRVVVVVSSLHDVSRTQAEDLYKHLSADHLKLLAPSLEQAIVPTKIGEWADSELAASIPLPEVVVIASPTERPAAGTNTSERSAHASLPTDNPATVHSSGGTSAAELIADSLATITYRVLKHSPVDALMLLGGEGARAVLSRLGAKALLVQDAIREGIPLGTIEGGTADGLTVVTKAGGFGGPSTVNEIVTELLDPASGAHAPENGSTPAKGNAP